MKIKFNDGTELENVQLIFEKDNELHIKTIRHTAEELKTLFKDSEKTAVIFLGETEFEGYVNFTQIIDYDNGILEVINEREGKSVKERLNDVESGLSTVESGLSTVASATETNGNDIFNANENIDVLFDAVAELGELVGE